MIKSNMENDAFNVEPRPVQQNMKWTPMLNKPMVSRKKNNIFVSLSKSTSFFGVCHFIRVFRYGQCLVEKLMFSGWQRIFRAHSKLWLYCKWTNYIINTKPSSLFYFLSNTKLRSYFAQNWLRWFYMNGATKLFIGNDSIFHALERNVNFKPLMINANMESEVREDEEKKTKQNFAHSWPTPIHKIFKLNSTCIVRGCGWHDFNESHCITVVEKNCHK